MIIENWQLYYKQGAHLFMLPKCIPIIGFCEKCHFPMIINIIGNFECAPKLISEPRVFF